MITVTLNRTEFEYDIHSLIKAFFPKEDVELYYTKEAHADEKNVACTNHSAEQEEAGSSHFSIDYADDRISIAWDDAPDGPARRTFAVDFSNRTETKNALKEHLYRLLEEETGQPLPWGTLTGIRPTKIPMQMLDEGKTKEEIASYMKQTYLASDEKINLSIAIAERERALLSQLDYKNGYSLYIGIPFCPSTCLYCSFTSYPLTAWKTQVDAYLDALEKEKQRIENLKKYEKEYAGYTYICGIDEVGRGPLCGPVVAAAVILPEDFVPEGINDSKKLSEKKREKLYPVILEKAVAVGIGEASPAEIDEINILNASFLAMRRAIENLSVKPDFALIDGNRARNIPVPCDTIVGGDAKSASIASASVVAKVYRDRLMKKLAEEYPQYALEKHKGYPTKEHYELLKKHGIAPIYRLSFLKNLDEK